MGQQLGKEEVSGRVAVITGAASGIGYGVAETCVGMGMRVVLADIDEAALRGAEARLREKGAAVKSVRCDVSSEQSVAALCDAVYADKGFGEVGLLFLNAGFSIGSSAYQTPMDQWRKQLGVNLYGVLHGIHSFVPKMVAQGTAARVVATSSYAGLINVSAVGIGGGAPYTVSKHGVTLAMEALQHELRTQKGCQVTAHVLCPGLVATNYAKTTVGHAIDAAKSDDEKARLGQMQSMVSMAYGGATTPAAVAAEMLRGLRDRAFYIIAPDPSQPAEMLHEMVRIRTDDIVAGGAPLSHTMRGDPRGAASRKRIQSATNKGSARIAQESAVTRGFKPRQLIGGRLEKGEGDVTHVVDPSSGKAFADCPNASKRQVDAAVAAARAAFPAWSALPVAERRALMDKAAAALQRRVLELASLVVREQGKAFKAAQIECRGGAMLPGVIARMPLPGGETKKGNTPFGSGTIRVKKTPVGVVGCILPWNFPVTTAQGKLAPAIYSGCTVVLKPSPETPLATLMLGEVYADVLPPGVVNIVSGGGDVGQWIVEHPGVDKISFTGSVATGRAIMRSSASTLKRLTLELGGNDAALILDDVDPARDQDMVRGVWNGAFANSGQACIAIKRLFVPRARHDAWVKALVEHTRTRKFGDGFGDGVEFGPVNNRKQFERVVGLVEDALKSGGAAAVGGAPAGKGFHYPATIITGLRDDARLVQEEQFGPVLPVLVYDDVADAVQRANSTEFGLGASVWGKDTAAAEKVALGLDAGTVWINKHAELRPDVPFGGIKQSGIGRENGKPGFEAFFETRVTSVKAAAKM